MFLAVKQHLAVGRDPAGVRLQETGNELQGQGLSGPGVTEQDRKFIVYFPADFQFKPFTFLATSTESPIKTFSG
jgi:hypothetical protein